MHLPDGLVDDPFSILQTNFFRERYFLRRCLNKSLPHWDVMECLLAGTP
jgi:hypothetical protein